MTAVAKPAAWLDNSFGARAKITISKDLAVGSTQSNYPFKLTSLHNVIYGLSRSDGQDIVVTDSGGVTEIERDVASFDRLSRAAELYIKLPSLSSALDSVIYLYFNNPSYYRGNDKVDRSITRMIRVAAGVNDCVAYWSGAAWVLDATATSVSSGYINAALQKMGGGFRFLNALCPRYSVVNQSLLTWESQGTYANDTVNSRLCGELSGTPAAFSTIANYQTRRGTDCGGADNTQRTVAQVAHDAIAHWTDNTLYTSPSLNTIFTEIIALNSIQDSVIFWDDHADRSTHAADRRRDAATYEHSSATCTLLTLNFTPVVTNYQTIELEYLGLEGNL